MAQTQSKTNDELILYRSTLDSTSDGIMVFDSQDRICYFNTRICELWDLPDDILVATDGKIVRAWMSGLIVEPELFYQDFEKLPEGDQVRYLTRLQMKDGRFFDRSWRAQFFEGNFVGHVLTIWETTERVEDKTDQLREAEALEKSFAISVEMQEALHDEIEIRHAVEDQLKYEADVKDRFFSIIAHDLTSPFNSLLGMTQMMAQLADKLSKDELIEYAANINEAGENVFQLLQNLLEWSRLQMAGVKIEPEVIRLRGVVQDCINISKPIAVEKNLQLTNRIEKGVVFADRDMVQVVLRNLIANALKFTSAGGSIEISSSNHGDMVQVTVADTGIGVSKDQLERIFALDQKTSTTGTAGEKGTGLGLPICKDMLERNGGKIWADSTPGEGSRFHFSLPVE